MGDVFAQMCNADIVEHIAVGNLKFNQLRLSVCKGVDLQCGGQIQNAGDLVGSLQLRVDNHGKFQFVPQVADLSAVIRCAYTGDGSTVAYTLGNGTAQQIQLVRFGDSNQQVSVFNACLHLYTVAGAIAHNAHDIVQVGQRLYQFGGTVDDGDVMPFPAELFNQGRSDLATADDDDAHSFLGRLFSSGKAAKAAFPFGVFYS